jgi:hypothetical protein
VDTAVVAAARLMVGEPNFIDARRFVGGTSVVVGGFGDPSISVFKSSGQGDIAKKPEDISEISGVKKRPTRQPLRY